MSAVGDLKPVIVAPEEEKEEKVADIKDWEGVKVMPQPKPQMDLEGITHWVLVDEIEILNKESEDKHIFTIEKPRTPIDRARNSSIPTAHRRGHRPRARRLRVQAAQHHAE